MSGRLPRAAAEAMADNAHGFRFGFTKKKWINMELAHILVLDGNFPPKGTIAIFIVTLK
jgi:hypothetical protein